LKRVGNLCIVDEQTPKGVDEGRCEGDAHGQWLTPPVVDSVGSAQPIEHWKFDAVTHNYASYPKGDV
jgi:hypothetical protein